MYYWGELDRELKNVIVQRVRSCIRGLITRESLIKQELVSRKWEHKRGMLCLLITKWFRPEKANILGMPQLRCSQERQGRIIPLWLDHTETSYRALYKILGFHIQEIWIQSGAMKFFWGHQWYGEVNRQEKKKNKSFYFLCSIGKINLRRIKNGQGWTQAESLLPRLSLGKWGDKSFACILCL